MSIWHIKMSLDILKLAGTTPIRRGNICYAETDDRIHETAM